MSDKMINSTEKVKDGGVKGIGDTVSVHYDEWNMNEMCDPIEVQKISSNHAYKPGSAK